MPERPDFDQIAAQAAAPPVVPPKRPIVGAAMADDDRPWMQDLDRVRANSRQS